MRINGAIYDSSDGDALSPLRSLLQTLALPGEYTRGGIESIGSLINGSDPDWGHRADWGTFGNILSDPLTVLPGLGIAAKLGKGRLLAALTGGAESGAAKGAATEAASLAARPAAVEAAAIAPPSLERSVAAIAPPMDQMVPDLLQPTVRDNLANMRRRLDPLPRYMDHLGREINPLATPAGESLLEALKAEGNLGFDFPSQAIAALRHEPEAFEIPPELQQAFQRYGHAREQYIPFKTPLPSNRVFKNVAKGASLAGVAGMMLPQMLSAQE